MYHVWDRGILGFTQFLGAETDCRVRLCPNYIQSNWVEFGLLLFLCVSGLCVHSFLTAVGCLLAEHHAGTSVVGLIILRSISNHIQISLGQTRSL